MSTSNAASQPPTLLIIGAGFAGVMCALTLAKKGIPIHITLVSSKSYFEYYPALYRVATGSSHLSSCIPLSEIFDLYKNVQIVEDTIAVFNPRTKEALGTSGARYRGDYVLLAVGNENTYFNIPGVEEISFSFKSIHQALRLKERIHLLFDRFQTSGTEEKLLSLHFVIVGGGPSGVELAGELAFYAKRMARERGIPESFITIDLVEAAPRVLASMPEEVSRHVTTRLRMLGVNVFANRMLVKSESWTILLNDMKLGAKTLIWAAGVKANTLFESITQFSYDGKGRVVVNDKMEAKGFPRVFIGGDNASTKYSGLAQTAIVDGTYIANTILSLMYKQEPIPYHSVPVSYDVPVGPGWAVLMHRGVTIYGRLAWIMRHLIDIRFYFSLLPWRRALRAIWNRGSTNTTTLV